MALIPWGHVVMLGDVTATGNQAVSRRYKADAHRRWSAPAATRNTTTHRFITVPSVRTAYVLHPHGRNHHRQQAQPKVTPTRQSLRRARECPQRDCQGDRLLRGRLLLWPPAPTTHGIWRQHSRRQPVGVGLVPELFLWLLLRL